MSNGGPSGSMVVSMVVVVVVVDVVWVTLSAMRWVARLSTMSKRMAVDGMILPCNREISLVEIELLWTQ